MRLRRSVVLFGKWVRVPHLVQRLYERFAYRLLGYSVSSTRPREWS